MISDLENKNTPTILVVMGATGDLAIKKIYPALYRLYKDKKLPKTLKIVGFSRRDLENEDFRNFVKDILETTIEDKAHFESFLSLILYHKAQFNDLKDYKSFANKLGKIDGQWKACSNKMFYLAVPPKLYKTILMNLSRSDLTSRCSDKSHKYGEGQGGWTRIIVEKPFGSDLKTAEDLDHLLGELFSEEQIFRIDHYLGKEMLRNVLAFRFSNSIFESSWNNKYVDSIEIKFLEKIGIEGRGSFYDKVGALRDVGQNHALQMLALVTMDTPGNFESGSIRSMRTKLLQTLSAPTREDVKKSSFRAQYKGFRDVSGVYDTSETETYFKVKASLDSLKWKGVDIVLEGGKALNDTNKEIVVNFKHPSPCLCHEGEAHKYHNKVIFSLEPKEEINIVLWAKKPGYEMEVEKKSFSFPYRGKNSRKTATEEYEKLLLDCFSGDQTLFVSTKGVEAMWKFVDPIINAWKENVVPLARYEKNTNDILGKPNF